jgi:hypothetical protein
MRQLCQPSPLTTQHAPLAPLALIARRARTGKQNRLAGVRSHPEVGRGVRLEHLRADVSVDLDVTAAWLKPGRSVTLLPPEWRVIRRLVGSVEQPLKERPAPPATGPGAIAIRQLRHAPGPLMPDEAFDLSAGHVKAQAQFFVGEHGVNRRNSCSLRCCTQSSIHCVIADANIVPPAKIAAQMANCTRTAFHRLASRRPKNSRTLALKKYI